MCGGACAWCRRFRRRSRAGGRLKRPGRLREALGVCRFSESMEAESVTSSTMPASGAVATTEYACNCSGKRAVSKTSWKMRTSWIANCSCAATGGRAVGRAFGAGGRRRGRPAGASRPSSSGKAARGRCSPLAAWRGGRSGGDARASPPSARQTRRYATPAARRRPRRRCPASRDRPRSRPPRGIATAAGR